MAQSLCEKRPLPEAGRLMLSRLSADVLRFEKGALRGEDIECVHRMRSRTNRLRVAIQLLGKTLGLRCQKRWRSDLKWLADALGPARDCDVMLECCKSLRRGLKAEARSRVEVFVAQMRERRGRAYAGLRAAFATSEWKRLKRRLKLLVGKAPEIWLERIAGKPRRSGELFKQIMAQCWGEIQKRRQRLLDSATPRRLHRFRLACKHARYTLEFFCRHSGKTGAARLDLFTRTTNCLGRIHDLEAFEAQMRAARIARLGEPLSGRSGMVRGIELLLERAAARREALFGEFEGLWRRLHEVGRGGAIGPIRQTGLMARANLVKASKRPCRDRDIVAP